MKQEQLRRFRVKLQTEVKLQTLQEHCRDLIASGVDYDEIAPIIWDIIVEKSRADPSWLPAASIVNHTDAFWHVAIQRPEDKHKQIWFGEPWPEFRRVEEPPPLEGTLEELQARLREVASTHDWLLTERCLLGIAQQSNAETLLRCLAEHLLPTYNDRSGPQFSETRVTTVRCMVDVWQRYGDEAIIPFACRYGARLCAKKGNDLDEQDRNAMSLLVREYDKLAPREPNGSPTFDEAAFRAQLDSGDSATAFSAITSVWQQGATLEQIELAMTMHCVERILRASLGDGANWDHLKIELMAVANITRLKPLGETLAIKSAYPAVHLILSAGDKGLAEGIPETCSESSNDEAERNGDLVEQIIRGIRRGNPSATIVLADRYCSSGGDGLELLRCLIATLGDDNTTAGQRCMIEAWHLAKKENHPARNRIPIAMAGWEASSRRRGGNEAPQRPKKGPAQIQAEESSEANVFTDTFDGTELSDQWRCRTELHGERREDGKPPYVTPIAIENGRLRISAINSHQLVTLRQNFTDFALTVDLRILNHLAGIIVRWNSPDEYYMVQVGIPWGDQAAGKVGAWHAFSPGSRGWREDMMQGTRLVENKWYRLRLEVEGFRFTLSVHALNDDDNNIVETIIDALQWEDVDKLFTSGAIGFWECMQTDRLGEQAEFRNLKVRPLDE